MNLPPLRNPERYAGLYVVDFGDHAAVGYTADEIAMLTAEAPYRDVTVYRIHRVDPEGRVELAGVQTAELAGQEVMLFLTGDSLAAGRDFRTLRTLAADHPLPCPVRAELIDLPESGYPHAVCLLYLRSASTMVSGWLTEVAFAGGEQVLGGGEALAIRGSTEREPVAAGVLPHRAVHVSRTQEEVLSAVDRPLQR